jgi:hypothetical protein
LINATKKKRRKEQRGERDEKLIEFLKKHKNKETKKPHI